MRLAASSFLVLLPALALGCQPSADVTTTPEEPTATPGAEPSPSGAPTPAPEAAPGEDLADLTCERPEDFGPIRTSQAHYDARYAGSAGTFSEVQSTAAQPAEVCGIAAGVELMLGLTCDDGSNPFDSFQEAHGSRVGNVGPGGRCGSIVDHYQAACPEATYDVFIDSYFCADGMDFG